MKIFCKYPNPTVKNFLGISNSIAKNFIWTTLKMIFSIFWFFFLHPRIPDFQVAVSQLNIVLSFQK